jgi:hypothetical protein
MSLNLTPIRTSCHTARRAVVTAALCSAAGACGSDPPPPAPRAFSASEQARFTHDEHVTKHKLECVECHHETNAARLDTPHDPYLSRSGIDCQVCHQGTSRPREPQACSTCHPVAETEVANETLSAKVVIHRTCWRCHPAGVGASASEVCGTCHGGVKPALAKQIAPPSFRRKGAK